jgi:putative protein-disulfide isomerase
MSALTLHYIYDPLCGWCYGSSPLLQAAAESNNWNIQLHAGGMMVGPNRQPVTPALRQFVLKHDMRIAELSGQPFGQDYREGLLRQEGVMFDSEPPVTAILAAGPKGMALLERIQRAHYVEGRRISDKAVLMELAAELGIDAAEFRDAFERFSGKPTLDHIVESRALLDRVHGAGFPTLAFERGGQFKLIDSSPFLGRVEEWKETLRRAGPMDGTQQPGAVSGSPADGLPP